MAEVKFLFGKHNVTILHDKIPWKVGVEGYEPLREALRATFPDGGFQIYGEETVVVGLTPEEAITNAERFCEALRNLGYEAEIA